MAGQSSWFGPLPALRNNVQKRLARFVLQRSIGQVRKERKEEEEEERKKEGKND